MRSRLGISPVGLIEARGGTPQKPSLTPILLKRGEGLHKNQKPGLTPILSLTPILPKTKSDTHPTQEELDRLELTEKT